MVCWPDLHNIVLHHGMVTKP